MPTPAGLAAGFVAHVLWFIACERLLAPAAAPPQASSAPLAARKATLAARPAAKGIAQAARQAQPKGFVNTPVMAVFDETPDIRTFRLARPDGFTFTAGQFLTVRLQAAGKEQVRCYSISSSPGSLGYLEISVKRIGLVSSALHATLRPGSLLMVRPPAGSFHYPQDDQRGLVLLAGGVGITPLMSMLRHAVESDTHRPVTLFYSVRRVEDIAFNDELTVLARRNEHVRIFIAVSEGAPGDGHFPGHISESLVTTMAPDVTHSVCMICGPQPMMDAMTAMLTSIGVPKAQIRFEVFQAAIAASSRVGTPAPTPAGGAADDDLHDITFERSGQQTRVSGSQTLLEAAEDCGAEIPSLCRAGVCGTCRTLVISGDTTCSSTILNDDDRAAGYVLACVTQVASACKVDA
ncbi:MAG: 2Fe-2S iron-sulfur cluster-binding protein [Vicinamibacterales bacterium]